MEIKKAYQYLENVLAQIYGLGEARSITQILFEDAFGVTNPQKIGEFSAIQSQQFLNYADRLLHREPIQYVLGQADFFGLKLMVNSDVLIPRQETEELVDWIIQSYPRPANLRILDIGTGSGCISVALKKKIPNAEIWAVDVSKKALYVARENAHRLDVDIQFRILDILDEKQWYTLPQFDIIVSNPPYISSKEKKVMPDWVLQYEPHLALFSENDPLLFYKKIADFARQNGNRKASLFYELNEFNAPQVKAILTGKGFRNTEIRQDLNGKDRMLHAVV